ncbi:hypothetical protein PAMP_015915 [Pampus punctatissimus]
MSRETRTDRSTPQRAAITATTERRTSRTQMASNPNLMGSTQHQESPSFLNFLPGPSPSPLIHQDFSSNPTQMGLRRHIPELVFTPCSPQDACWLNMSPLASTSDSCFGFSPYPLVPFDIPTETWFSPCSPAHSWLHPSCCMCPQSVSVHQPCSLDLLSSRAEPAASGREQCKPEEKKETPVGENLQGDNNTIKSEICRDLLDEELLAKRAFEDYVLIMDTLSHEIQENVDAKAQENEGERDGEEEEEPEIYSDSFLAYLDELCMDEVELTLNIEYLESLLSSSPTPTDLPALEEQEQVTSTLNTDEHIDPFLSSDPRPINFLPLREPEQEILDVCLRVRDSFPLHEEYCSPLDRNGPFFTATLPPGDGGLEDILMSLKNVNNHSQWSQKLQDGFLPGDCLAAQFSSSCSVSGSPVNPHLGFRAGLLTDSSPQPAGPPDLSVLAWETLFPLPPPPAQIREAEEHHSPVNPKSFPTSPEQSDNACYAIPAPASLAFVDSCDPQVGDKSVSVPAEQTAESPERQAAANPGIFSELRTVEWRDTETKPEIHPENWMIKKEKEDNETELKGTANAIQMKCSPGQSGQKLSPEKVGLIYEKQPSREKEIQKREESQGTVIITAGRSGKTEDKTNANVCIETRIQNALLTKTQDKMGQERETREDEEVQMSSTVRPRTRSTTVEEKVQPSPVSSPSTRARQKIKHSKMQRSEIKSSPERETQDDPELEVNVQENLTEPPMQPVSSPEEQKKGRANDANETDTTGCEDPVESALFQTDAHSKRDSKEDRLEESPAFSTRTCEENKPMQQEMKTVGGGDFYSLRSTIYKNTRQVRTLEKPNLLKMVTQATQYLFGLRNRSRPDKTADVKLRNDEEHPSLTLSPAKRHQQQHEDKVDLETEMRRLSPIKRTRRTNKTEGKFERVEEKTGNENRDETETSGCISAEAAGKETSEAKKDVGKRDKTRTDCFSCKRRTRLSVKLPTKYQDFIVYTSRKGHDKHLLDERRRKTGKGKRSEEKKTYRQKLTIQHSLIK